jgi:hypothetical protein
MHDETGPNEPGSDDHTHQGQNTTLDVERALSIAQGLVAAGVPMFLAAGDPDGRTPSGKGTGFILPRGWQDAEPDPGVIDRWQPGMALCAVAGHAVDFVDVDPRNGGDVTAEALREAGTYPKSFGRARTPSGGTHDLIAPLGIPKGKREGIDLQAGAPDGKGRGFVFISPTVKRSKETSEPAPYVWEVEPDLAGLAAANGDGSAFAEWVKTRPGKDPSRSRSQGRRPSARRRRPERRPTTGRDRSPKASGTTSWRPTPVTCSTSIRRSRNASTSTCAGSAGRTASRSSTSGPGRTA